MIDIVMLSGVFHHPKPEKVESLRPLLGSIEEGFQKLVKVKKAEIIDLFDKYSKTLLKDERVKGVEGIAFLSSWLRKSNFKKIVERNLGSLEYLETFVGDRKRVKAQPRGKICHWIAGNVPTLGLFSLFQSMLVGNANLMRIPPGSHDTMVRLLEVFADTSIDTGLTGRDLLQSVAIVYYPRDDARANNEFSDIADARVVWGGEAAVRAITGLPRRAHCEDVVFGPKYSFAAFDREAIASERFNRYLRFLVGDVLFVDQAACTSPHVVFFEKGSRTREEIARLLADEFRSASLRYPKTSVDQYIMSKIINIRAEYALDLEKDVLCPRENDWTILMNDDLALEEPIESRTVWVKMVDSIFDIVPLITRKVQTIGCAIENKDALVKFADEVTRRGVARCVNLGQMHLYDSPWDGVLFMSRLVNWVTLYHG